MTAQHEWRGDWRTAEDQSLRAGLAATPEQRLEWLEAALELAQAAGALETRPDASSRHGRQR